MPRTAGSARWPCAMLSADSFRARRGRGSRSSQREWISGLVLPLESWDYARGRLPLEERKRMRRAAVKDDAPHGEAVRPMVRPISAGGIRTCLSFPSDPSRLGPMVDLERDCEQPAPFAERPPSPRRAGYEYRARGTHRAVARPRMAAVMVGDRGAHLAHAGAHSCRGGRIAGLHAAGRHAPFADWDGP